MRMNSNHTHSNLWDGFVDYHKETGIKRDIQSNELLIVQRTKAIEINKLTLVSTTIKCPGFSFSGNMRQKCTSLWLKFVDAKSKRVFFWDGIFHSVKLYLCDHDKFIYCMREFEEKEEKCSRHGNRINKDITWKLMFIVYLVRYN